MKTASDYLQRNFLIHCQLGRIESLQHLLAGVQAQTYLPFNQGMMAAVERNRPKLLEYLYEQWLLHAKPSKKEIVESKNFLLVPACQLGHLEIARFLFTKPSPDTSHNDHQALKLACKAGHVAMVELLLSKGAQLQHNEFKAFKLACESGQAPLVHHLLDKKLVPLAQKTPYGLKEACAHNHLEIVKLIVSTVEMGQHSEKGNNNTQWMWPAFRQACRREHADIIEYFIHAKTISRPDYIDDYPLVRARMDAFHLHHTLADQPRVSTRHTRKV